MTPRGGWRVPRHPDRVRLVVAASCVVGEDKGCVPMLSSAMGKGINVRASGDQGVVNNRALCPVAFLQPLVAEPVRRRALSLRL